jgi:hypothetical protein
MASLRSTTRPRDDAPAQGGEGAIIERGAVDEGHDSVGSVQRTESVRASDAGSQSNAKGDSHGGSCAYSWYFGPSIVTVSRIHIREMIDQGYLTERGARALGEETIPEPENDEAVVFEEFFIAGLRMPPHSVFAGILLKFQVQLH